MSDLAAIADDLYALAPGAFTAARNARAKEAAADGDRVLAGMIRRLPRPAVSAGVVNALVRQRREEVEQLLRLGAAMRVAQAELDRDGLASLGQQRRQLVGALTRAASELAANLGHPVSTATHTEVEQTLLAAMADERAARALLRGRLLRALQSVGFDGVDLTDAEAAPGDAEAAARTDAGADAGAEADGGAPAPGPASRSTVRSTGAAGTGQSGVQRAGEPARQRELDRARRELEGAEQRVGDTAAQLDFLDGRIARTARRRELLDVELSELRDQLQSVERDREDAVEERRALERESDRARRALAEAERAAARARGRLDRLS